MRSLNKAEGWEQPGGAGAGPWGVRGEQGSSDAHGEVVCVDGGGTACRAQELTSPPQWLRQSSQGSIQAVNSYTCIQGCVWGRRLRLQDWWAMMGACIKATAMVLGAGTQVPAQNVRLFQSMTTKVTSL